METLKNLKILIVDDEPANLKVLYNILKVYSFRLFMLQDSTIVLSTIQKEIPDLILLDVMMPEMDGYELCKKIKESKQYEHIPIIFISALNDTSDIVRGFEVGGVDYIAKPFRNEEVICRVKTHLTIQKQKKELWKLNENKDRFFSILAHDLRGSLGDLPGFLNIIRDTLASEDIPSSIEIIDSYMSSAKAVSKLLDDLLAWGKLQRNKIELNLMELSVNPIVYSILSLYTEQAARKNIQLENLLSTPYEVYADESMFGFVLRNLIHNAIKFTYPNGKVSVYADTLEDKVKIYIEDTGKGMSPEEVSKLFKIEEKSYSKGTMGEKGSGLGLVVAMEFLQKQNGELSVKSEKGKGSIFCITLPNKKLV